MRGALGATVGGMVVTAIVSGAVMAAPSPPSKAVDREGVARDRQIGDLINHAVTLVQRADRGCRPGRTLGRPPTFTDDAPSPELLQTLGVLRRPQSPEEAELSNGRISLLSADGLYRRYIRIARSASGRSYVIVAARNTNFLYKPRPRRCARALRERFGELLVDRPQPFRRAARRALDGVIRREWTAPTPEPREGVYLLDYLPGGSGGGGGGVDLGFIKRKGMFVSSSGMGRPAVVSGLLPDGVASLTAILAREASRGPHRPPKRYPSTVRRTVPVQDNVVSFTVPRPAQDAFPTRMIWRDAADRIVRVVRGRG